MTREHKLYELSKELVYQMTGKHTKDIQDGNFQIAWHYLSKSMDFTPSCTELFCDNCEETATTVLCRCDKCEEAING